MNRALPLALLAVLAAPALGGCLDRLGLGDLARPNYAVSRTALNTTEGWNRDGTFIVQVLQETPVAVHIDVTSHDGTAPLAQDGMSDAQTPVTMQIPDGTWDVSYKVGGHRWETFKGARFDSTPPGLAGLEAIVHAPSGSADFGDRVSVDAGTSIQVIDQRSGSVVATALPVHLADLPDGVRAYDVVAADEAGNEAVATVQVIAGTATQLPAPKYDAGVVARYTTSARMWDLTNMSAYDTPAEARAAAPGYLGNGTGVAPDDPDVRAVVDSTVTPGMTTAQAALALYRWMFDHLDYDESRLDDDNLLAPAQTLHAGGGVCRDLAALYVSLLRADGIPARLVAGYLAGRVNGFHAWAEFYGGAGPSPWVPVDVSGIDGPYTVDAMLQSFAVSLPEHLPLRALTHAEETTDWSSAATLGYTAPARSSPPDAQFQKQVTLLSEDQKVLCVNEKTYERHVADRATQCKVAWLDHFTVAATRTLDYGVDIRAMAKGTTLQLSLVYPDQRGASPDNVDFRYYTPPASTGWQSGAFREDASTGRAGVDIKA